MEAKMPVLLLSLGLLSTGTCYLRGDYNPGLYIFAYLLWNFKPHVRQTLVYIVVYSWLVDLAWTLTALLLWRTEGFAPSQAKLHSTVLLASAVLFALKLFLIMFMVVASAECRKWLQPRRIIAELGKFCAGESVDN